jgi:hypothetical protein
VPKLGSAERLRAKVAELLHRVEVMAQRIREQQAEIEALREAVARRAKRDTQSGGAAPDLG